MGYTVFAKVKSPEVAKAFGDFFYDHCEKGITAVIKSKYPTYPISEDKYSALSVGKDNLGYTGHFRNGDRFIGFDYNAAAPSTEREFAFEVVRMIQREEGKPTHYYYDGSLCKIGPKTLRTKIRGNAEYHTKEDHEAGRTEQTVEGHIEKLTQMACYSYDWDNVKPDQILTIIDDEVERLRTLWLEKRELYIEKFS